MSTFRFLDLPFEIRALVYAKYQDSITICFQLKYCRYYELTNITVNPMWEFCAIERIEIQEKGYQRRQTQPPSLLKASRQLRSECLEHLAQHKPLYVQCLRPTERGFDTLTFHVPSLLRDNLRQVTTSTDLVDKLEDRTPDVLHWVNRLVSMLPALRHFELRDWAPLARVQQWLQPGENCADVENAPEATLYRVVQERVRVFDKFLTHVRGKSLTTHIEMSARVEHGWRCCGAGRYLYEAVSTQMTCIDVLVADCPSTLTSQPTLHTRMDRSYGSRR